MLLKERNLHLSTLRERPMSEKEVATQETMLDKPVLVRLIRSRSSA
jgi:hypothetical protein